ncbi:MAG TPA: sigma 54-interacting transcriptional regulator, partial [Candidatus Sulfotelmatobacter sp.]|nr:sigma 54-interacting transcriptional regulator [Candidatus Sulfotelmatobacter sp.]
SVVNELQPVLVPPRGLFASGKFDQYKRDIPYSTLGQAFQSLIRPLLTKNEQELEKWRCDLLDALDPNGQLIVDLVPELKLVIGDQPPVPEVAPQDAQRRFQIVIRRFIGVFARPEHPLALFLDDLQWLDAATLDLLEDLLTRSELQHLMLIGAYRDNEVDAAHPLMRKLAAIKSAGGTVKEIALGPLAREHLAHLLADALRSEPDRSAPLAQLVHEKTGGNPFFAIQFISSLAAEGMLTFDHDAGRWSWDLHRIHAQGYTDNVVDLMAGKLVRLPAQTQRALQQMACLGNAADVPTLSKVLEMPQEQANVAVWESVRQGLVELLDDTYKFTHDRIQEAAYSLIPEASRTEAHLHIGRLLWARTPPEKREEKIFDIVNQLNRGAALITSREERENLAELNLIAGKRAKASTAHASARKYFAAGAELVGDDCWERRRDLIFALELEQAQCEFVTGELEAADERLSELSRRASNTVERAAVACLHMDLCTERIQFDRGITIGLDYLRQIGINLSPHPTEDDVRREYEQIWSNLGSSTIEQVVDFPLMNGPESLATLDVLLRIGVVAAVLDENLNCISICKAVNFSLKQGNCGGSSYAYVVLGRVAIGYFRDYKTAFRFGQVGIALIEARGLKDFEARAYAFFADLIAPWMNHVQTSIDMLRRAFDAANKAGDITFVAYALFRLNSDLLIAGARLGEVQREAELGLASSLKTKFSGLMLPPQLALVRTLRGLTPKFGCFDSKGMEETSFERFLGGSLYLRGQEGWYWLRKMVARYFAGEYADAMEASLKAQRLLVPSRAMIEEAECHFYSALCRAACCDSATGDERVEHLEALAAHHRQIEIWAENCPANFENRAALVGAEIARIENSDMDAMRLYEKAIRSSRTNGFINNQALAYERASEFYRARGFDQFADDYLRNARACYASWGADGKVRQLDQLHPDLKPDQAFPGPGLTITAPVEGLDLATVIRVSQAVSSEIVLEKLFDTVMRKAMEHAGAEKGLLAASRGDELQVEAESTTRGNDVIVRLGDSLATAMPESIVRYVMRTHESVILDDASSANPFSADPYFLQNCARSILCLPLLNQAKLSGILYLENNLAPRVFTSDRIALLRVLVSQAAISLENTRLYRDLEDREARIRRLVDANILGIVTWNVEGAVLSANEAFLRMLQYDHQEVVPGRVRWWDMVPADWRARTERALAEVIRTGTAQPFESEMLRKDGSRVPVLIGATLFQIGGNDGVGFVLDLSEQKRAEAEIRALKDQLYKENLALRDEIDRTSMFEEIVGTSSALRSVVARISKVAPTDSTVLITGETGTGKELVARAIHRRSSRAKGPFVSVNCAAIPRELIASELFGHEKGAFTGATQRRHGRFELAAQGTIFLDEAGELPPETQVALLRVLQEREFERIGGTGVIRTDVRVIAATNRDLDAEIAAGRFRSDLYYRLNVFPIEMPPLRDRKEDIPLLVEYFIDRYARKAGKSFESISKKSLQSLQSYPWPGNIRELQNVIERSVIVNETKTFSVDQSWLSRQPQMVESGPRRELSTRLAAQEKELIEAALRESGGRVSGPSGAAAKLGMPGSTLESKIKALKINKNRFKA